MALKNIGRYQIKSELGRGGMATVYHAYDPRFDRDVAVKVLPREFLHDPQFRLRFEREARTIARLEHPAIVPVHDYGDADGQLYLVMRLMVGGSLSERLKAGPLPLAEVARIFNRLAPALDAAHARGIIHRDLKPDNILFDQWEGPHLSDFGIAKLVAGSKTALTATGGIVGTPAYMSPEQVRAVGELDGRSDIYALGVILFEMLTGRQPFTADTPIGLAVMHLNEPVPLVERSNPDLPAACQRVIDHAMAKDRENRPGTAADLAIEISEMIPTVAAPAPEVVEVGLATELWSDTALFEAPPAELEEAETVTPEASFPGLPGDSLAGQVDAARAGPEAVADEFDVDAMFGDRWDSETRPAEAVAETEVLDSAAFPAAPDMPAPAIRRSRPSAGEEETLSREPAIKGSGKRLLWVLGGVALLALAVLLGIILVRPDDPVLPGGQEGNKIPMSDYIDEIWQKGFEASGVAYGQGNWVVVAARGDQDRRQTWRLEEAFPGEYITARWSESYDLTDLVYGDGQWLAMMSSSSGGQRQTWRLERDFPEAFINEKWAEGYDVSALAYGDGQWAVVMALGGDDRQQTWRLEDAFPAEFVSQKWAESYEISSLAYGHGQWAVIMSSGGEEGRQTWRLDDAFPAPFIEEKWADGYEITSLANGGGQWAVVMTKGSAGLQQTWHMSKSFQ